MVLNVSIEKSTVVVVEGIDDRILLNYLCDKWDLSNVQFVSINQTPNFDNILAVINMPGFHQIVKAFGIIRDADDQFQSAKQSVEDILHRLDLNIKTGHFIFPDNNNPGRLETLLMQASLVDADRMNCVDHFMTCLARKSINISDHRMDKAKVYTYLSAFDEPGKRIGEAACAGYWNHSNEVFNNLRIFLFSLAN